MLNSSPLNATLFESQTLASATSKFTVIDCRSYNHLVVFLRSDLTTSGGTIGIYESWDAEGFKGSATGTATIATINATDVDATGQLSYHLPVAAYRYLQVRIATDITGGGDITAYLGGAS